MAIERSQINDARFDAEAVMRMDSEGPIPARSPKASKEIYDALDRQLMTNMSWEGPTGAQAGRRVRNGAISFAKVRAGTLAEQHGPRIPGSNGNGKA